MEDLNVTVAGVAGQGVQTIGDVLTQTAAAQGYAVFNWKEYESRIHGGQNSYSIRISEAPINAPVMGNGSKRSLIEIIFNFRKETERWKLQQS